ncbi:MAG: hypothetical protein IT365_13980 [Candidatus Hydrogenedentes bacterium]|nr:hypothetical protein [Candidatus Hydrogenedentota bacterium]
MDSEQRISSPPLRLKLEFWLLLGMLSTAFAEVVSGSSPFPFFTPWGVIVVAPLYTLHILVLAGILNRFRLWSWQGLCFAGALFGLYEAYITKVLWEPTWCPELIAKVWDVSWPHTILLVLWWHPLMAFILPLAIAETLLTKSRRIVHCLPRGLRALAMRHQVSFLAVLLAVACGLATTAPAPSVPLVMLSTAANSTLLVGLILLWRHKTRGCEYTLSQLLPGDRGLIVSTALLFFLYAVTGAALRPEAFPSAKGHLAIAALYVLFILALIRSRHFTCGLEHTDVIPAPPGTITRAILTFAAVYIGVAIGVKGVLGPASILFALIHWAGALLGLGVYVYAFHSLRRTQSHLTRNDVEAHAG